MLSKKIMKPKLSTVKSSQDISDGSKTIRFYQKLLMNGTIPVGGGYPINE